MKMNKEWHLKNKISAKATFDQRVKWHIAHQKNCACRPIPAKLAEEMGKKAPEPGTKRGE